MKITGKMMVFDGMPCFVPNDVMDCTDFYISYNNYDIRSYGSDTTALVKGNMEKFYILDGNHTKQYNELVAKGFDACLDYFKDNANLINKYSDSI